MQKFNKVVVSVHAHPDDTEAWNAGTLKRLSDKGYHIVIVTMTAGGMGGIGSNEDKTITIRHKEARKAAEVIGADYICLGGRDGYLFDNEELRLDVTRIVRDFKAGIVMTHLPMDYHVDHRATCNIVEAATMVASLPNVPVQEPPLEITPLLYHTAPLTLMDPIGAPIVPPHFYVDVTSVMDTKRAMLQHHASQKELMKVMHKMDDFFDHVYQGNKDYGALVGVDYAEVFWQHLGGGFQKDSVIQEELKEYIRYNK